MSQRSNLVLTFLTVALGALACAPARDPSEGGRAHEALTEEQRRDREERLKLAEGATAKLRLLATTDLHVNLESFDYYKNAPTQDTGFARTATLLRRARGEAKNSLTIDNGDLIQGSPLGDWFKASRDPKVDLHPVYKAMNLVGYDVANIGNHEFNYGLDFLEAALSGARFPYVSANVFRVDDSGRAGRTLEQPYVILQKQITLDDGTTATLRVGVIGFVPPQIMVWDRTNLLGKVVARDIVDVATETVPRMKAEGADIVIAVPHSGINASPRSGNDENAVYYLSQVPGIDAILCGHSHQVFPSATYQAVPNADIASGRLNGIPVVMAGSWGSHLGVVDLDLKLEAGRWHVASGRAEAREVKTLLSPEEAESDVRAVVAEDHQATLTYLTQEVGATEQAIDSYFALLGPSLAVKVVQDAQSWYAARTIEAGGEATAGLRGIPLLSASAPLKAGGKPSNYTDVAAGPLTLRSVADMYVYPNTLKVVKVTGAGLRDWLEMAAGAFNTIDPTLTTEQELASKIFPAYNFDHIAGVEYEIDVTQKARFDKGGRLVEPDAHRITKLTYEGKDVEDDAVFLVVTNNYRANGGGFFPGLDGTSVVLDPGRESREVLRDYVLAVGTIRGGAPRNWRLRPVTANGPIVVKTSPAAQGRLATAPEPLEYLGEAPDDGFGRYRLRWPTAP
jgi:2',3'-cyclic-nucleotide 2'-phosphodiesterase/3'-nucleotidase